MKDFLDDFQPWMHWSERSDRLGELLHYPGVYMLARFDAPPYRRKPKICKEIIYIGEACSQTLSKRLSQFGRSCTSKKKAHSGGSTFYGKFKENKIPDWLFISVLVSENSEPHNSAYIRFVERSLIWSFVQRYKEMPVCNRK